MGVRVRTGIRAVVPRPGRPLRPVGGLPGADRFANDVEPDPVADPVADHGVPRGQRGVHNLRFGVPTHL